jgi:hypothetical protein
MMVRCRFRIVIAREQPVKGNLCVLWASRAGADPLLAKRAQHAVRPWRLVSRALAACYPTRQQNIPGAAGQVVLLNAFCHHLLGERSLSRLRRETRSRAELSSLSGRQ